MLVLTRKADAGDSSIVTVGEDVEVTVLEVSGDSVRIGITAPRGTEVHRKEVYLLRKAEAEQAAGAGQENQEQEPLMSSTPRVSA